MTILNFATCKIKTYSTGFLDDDYFLDDDDFLDEIEGSFNTEKFDIDKIRDRVRVITGIPDIVTNVFIHDVISDFCKQTWILRKSVEISDVVDEIDNGSDYYYVTIDLTDYVDGLEVHDLNEIKIDGIRHPLTKYNFLGNLTEAYSTKSGGYHYNVIDETTITVWPIDLNSVNQIPIIFKTPDDATEIPYVLKEYYQEIASGIIANVRQMPRYAAVDIAFHDVKYKKGLSKAKKEYARNYKGKILRPPQFAV